MNILLVGDKSRREECKHILHKELQVTESDGPHTLPEALHPFEVIIDLNFDERAEIFTGYFNLNAKLVVVGAVRRQLAEMMFINKEGVSCLLTGINSVATFLHRSRTEISFLDEAARVGAKKLGKVFNTEIIEVDDRVGMVTPRVVCMIINEACFTLQEGTASVEDIDKAMRLGTNYPKGPFEWADAIGISHVFSILQALWKDTGDERYKICPLLKTMYLRRETFYPPA